MGIDRIDDEMRKEGRRCAHSNVDGPTHARPAVPPRPQTIYLHVTDNKAPFHPAVLILAGVTEQGEHIPPLIEAKPRKRTGIKETKPH